MPRVKIVALLSLVFAATATAYCISHGLVLAYGDAESHLNIAKRVIDSLTPGLAQLGGIWLPLPHLLMMPFAANDYLWRTGLAGAIVSGLAYILSAVFVYKLAYDLTRSNLLAGVAFLVFALNPNILYLQSTAMTELPLIAFFLISVYYLHAFFRSNQLFHLILAAVIGLAASLTRYDGWFLVGFEAITLLIWQLKRSWPENEAKLLVFSTMAFVGIGFWLLWDLLILNDPFYFTNSPFSAKSQQQSWFARGELPAYHNLFMSLLYYLVTAYANIGSVIAVVAVLGWFIFQFHRPQLSKFLLSLLLFVPLIFYTATLYLGQSVIFIPSLTPASFEWRLFNVRYGLMLVPVAAIFFAVGFRGLVSKPALVWSIVLLILGYQYFLIWTGKEPVIAYEDGVRGLSAAKQVDAQNWLKNNYDSGLVLIDDYARTLSIIRSGLPMENVIYIGTKPFWEESIKNPAAHARWIVMQKDDTVWKSLNDDPVMQGQLYAHFAKVYTSPQILIFKRT